MRVFYESLSVPVNSVLLLSSREQALTFPTGDIRLGFCEGCGFIYNTSFDRHLVEYSSRCEETQGFSPFFRAWHEGLARRLIDRYSLHAKNIVEIGCGKGEFLTLLCDLGDNRGIGFDPAYIPERTAPQSASRIRFISDFYTEENSGLRADFLCCKMTLEHIANTAQFIKLVRCSLRNSYDTSVFFQVPDVLRVLEEEAFWDIYYEHCSYFSVGSLARLFRSAGFDVLDVGREYNNQYVTIEGRAGSGAGSVLAAEDDLDNLKEFVQSYATRVPRRIAEWRKRLESYREKGLKTVVWGAGSKGVTFLSTLNIPGAVEYVVDINPNMSAHYMAKTGLEIVGPSVLRDYRPDVVIVMNPVYRQEIIDRLANLGLRPEVMST
ncbi:MAG TPA: class I SAM-dependent methyltransferase [Pyrinomonadaceae bacterium]|nr:class I SAM-dependent methyltransferase [Pyrinomonadaceae bacterium]